MRETKFRAYNTYENKMYDWNDLIKKDSNGNLTLSNLLNNFIEHIKSMEYTGLKDKNGKGGEVYEGDIFEAIYKDCPDGFKYWNKETTVIPINCEVVFKWGQFAIKIMHPQEKKYVYRNLYDFLKNDEKVVIGNIFTNPELLNNK